MNKFLSRKFVLAVLFMVFVALNSALQWEIPWQNLLALATVIGLYSVSNAYQSAQNEPFVNITKFEDVTEPVAEESVED